MAEPRDQDIYYEEYGSGDPLILILGLGQDMATWGLQIPEFSKTHRVIVLDNRDSGKSYRSTGPYATADMADDVILLMDRLSIDLAHVLGVSMGGMIAQQVAMRAPERIKSLVLASTTNSGEG
ncbi:MAG: alpha/beta fold hydrolase [Deltaproteobacteria bacterium]|nr:alpha/beta fold hydrolase [Deltaproteobacteria bacterium]